MTTQSSQDTNDNSLNNWLSRSITFNWEVIVFLIILALAIITRFYALGDRVMSHDESLHTRFSYNLYADGDFQHTPLMHGPILFHAVAASYALFGASDYSARIYTAFLSVIMVMMPLLFRRWLGKWGTILASLMLLISPLLLYYGRYIRHDTPSIVSALFMIWAMMMYIGGPENQQRRAHWLYIIAAAMIWNLGSKETAFIYIAIIGIFLAIFFFTRLYQHLAKRPSKGIFQTMMIGIFLGGVMSLGMYIILDIVRFDMFAGPDGRLFSDLSGYEQSNFFIWTFISIGSVIAVALSTMLYVYRNAIEKIPWREFLIVLGIAITVCFGLVVFEELSHTTDPNSVATVAEPSVPGEEGINGLATTSLDWSPMILVWGGTIAGFIVLFLTRRKEEDDDFDIGDKPKHGRGVWGTLDLFPEFDVMVVIGTLILPWATAFIPYLMEGTAVDHAAVAQSFAPITNFISTWIPRIGTEEQIGVVLLHAFAFIPLLALSAAIGLMWNWKRWLIAAGIFHLLMVFFFTTVFTNINGIATGWIWSLGYWLEQQGVRRGGQPQYYYLLVIMPFYEFLPVIGGFLSMFAGTTLFWKMRKNEDEAVEFATVEAQKELYIEQLTTSADEADEIADASAMPNIPDDPEELGALAKANISKNDPYVKTIARSVVEGITEFPFLIFFAWLAILNLVGYSLAGEKMPWLGTHLTMPLIFLTAWYFGGIFDKIDFATFRKRGWMVSAVMLVAIIGLARTVLPLIAGTRPFAGLQQAQLEVTYEWLAALIVTSAAFAGLNYFAKSVGWAHIRRLGAASFFIILSLITYRSAYTASFMDDLSGVGYDYPTEFLVYAHAAPGVKWVLEDIEELSLRITDGNDLKFAYDNEVSWPYSWYFRNFDNVVYVGENPTIQQLDDAVAVVVGAANLNKVEPILEDRYIRFDYMRLWWPMQEYFGLTPTRVNNALSLNPSNTQAAQIRRGIFDIWWSRDYSTFGEAVEKDYSIENWPVSDRMHFYVRKDFAAQIWEYGVGEGGVANPLDEIEQNQCTANWQPTQAIAEFTAPDGMTNPIGVSVAPDGTIYVAEEFGHRISTFDSQGTYLGSFGEQGIVSETDIALTRPNSIDINDAGLIAIADTWNYRVQVLNQDLDVQATFGQAGTFGFDAPQQPNDGLWGPRDVLIDRENRIFVSDTGNKRIRVYRLIENEAVFVYDIGSGGSALGELNEPSGLALHSDGRLFVADTWNRRINVYTAEGIFIEAYDVRGWYQDLGNRPYLAIDEARDLLYVSDPDSGRVLVYTTGGDCLGSFGQAAGTTPSLGQFGVASGIAVDDEGFVYISDSELGRVLRFPAFQYVPVFEEAVQDANLVPEDSGEDGVSSELTDEVLEPIGNTQE